MLICGLFSLVKLYSEKICKTTIQLKMSVCQIMFLYTYLDRVFLHALCRKKLYSMPKLLLENWIFVFFFFHLFHSRKNTTNQLFSSNFGFTKINLYYLPMRVFCCIIAICTSILMNISMRLHMRIQH